MQKEFKKFLMQDEDEFYADKNLERLRQFMHKLNNPQNKFFNIHIAGSNGKGSVANFLANILNTYKIGIYTSPHLIEFEERIRINSQKISKKELFKYFKNLYKLSKSYAITSFELATALAFNYFSEQNVDFGIIECGLGCKYDATNIINSKISIITNIALEHTNILGNSLIKIAKEKAEIIKKNSTFFTFESNKRLLNVFRKKCEKLNSEFFCINPAINPNYGYEIASKGEDFIEVDFFTPNTYYPNIKLNALYQADNALLSIAVAEFMKEMNYIRISSSRIAKAIEKTKILGRFNILHKDPLFVVDVAHNPAGISALVKSLKIYGSSFRVIFSCCKDKNAKEMLEHIKPICKELIITQFFNKRAIEKEKLLRISKSLGMRVKIERLENLVDNIKLNMPTVVCGSHFLAKEFLQKKFLRGELIERGNGSLDGSS